MSDMIAFNLDGSYAWNYYMAGEDSPHCTKMSKGRFLLKLGSLNRESSFVGVIPQEMVGQKEDRLDSVD